MELSVVVPTLNGRERLAACLDSLSDHAPAAETVVVNGPSADGTTGMVRDRADVDVLVEVADRNLNVARNAGGAAAGGDAVAFLDDGVVVEEGWADRVRSGLESADVVTGPTHRPLAVGTATDTRETDRVAGRSVTQINGDNAAFTRSALRAIDGFDEYLQTGAARDGAHRLAGLNREVVWEPGMAVRDEYGADGGQVERDWAWKYRAFGYRMAKEYGPRPGTVRRVVGHAAADCVEGAREFAAGDLETSSWLGAVRSAAGGLAVGARDGLLARVRDPSPAHNPNGLSARSDRAVQVYDWR